MTAKKSGYVVFSVEIEEAGDEAHVRLTVNDKLVVDEHCKDIGHVLEFTKTAIDDAIRANEKRPF